MLHLEKKIEGFDNILKQQQNLTESVRTERNFYSKNLVAAQDQINEMNRKFKLMNHSVEQLKEDLNSKDVALMKEHFDFLKVKKLLDRTFMLWNMRKCLSHARRNISQRMKKYIVRVFYMILPCELQGSLRRGTPKCLPTWYDSKCGDLKTIHISPLTTIASWTMF